MSDAPDDETLVSSALQGVVGDLRPFEELVRRHQSKIQANCRFLCGSEDTAQDLAQEVFIKAFFGLKRFEGRSEFGTWLQRIKVNHCVDHLRKEKREKVLLDIDDPSIRDRIESERYENGASPEPVGSVARVRDVLEKIPDPYRVPLVMCDIDGCSYQEIADSLGLSLSAVKMRIKRARELFRDRYTKVEASLIHG